MRGVERDFQQAVLGAHRLECGLASLLEFALEPWRYPFDQFGWRIVGRLED